MGSGDTPRTHTSFDFQEAGAGRSRPTDLGPSPQPEGVKNGHHDIGAGLVQDPTSTQGRCTVQSAYQPEVAKTIYENLDSLAHLAGDPDPLAVILTDLLGLQVDRRRSGPHWVRDPDRQRAAQDAARRWLRDRGYLHLPRQSPSNM